MMVDSQPHFTLRKAIHLLLLLFFVTAIVLFNNLFFTGTATPAAHITLHLFVTGVLLFTAVIIGIQYFIFNDATYFFYTIYILLNLTYFTLIHLGDASVIASVPRELREFLSHTSLPLLTLIYLFYTYFAIGFLNVKKTLPRAYKLIKYITHVYLALFILSAILPLLFGFPILYNTIRTLILVSCMPLGLISIIILWIKVKTVISKIFCIGTACFFCGSVMGFLFSRGVLITPLQFPFSEWVFYTEAGTILEIILFTSSFAFRNKLMLQEDLSIKENLLIQMQENQEKELKLQGIRNEIASNLHDDLGASLSNINILNELAWRNKENPEKAEYYLKNASEDIRRISETLGDIVWNINPRFDNDLSGIFIRMKRYAADMLEGSDIIPKLLFPATETGYALNMECRKEVYLVFKEAINNMAKYSKAKEGHVLAEIKEGYLHLRVFDDGIGFEPGKNKSGNGLYNMRQRAEACNGKIEIISAENMGTSITLVVPLGINT
ncbi:MAG: ATP-binding protein [Ferruginibacter sp.]